MVNGIRFSLPMASSSGHAEEKDTYVKCCFFASRSQRPKRFKLRDQSRSNNTIENQFADSCSCRLTSQLEPDASTSFSCFHSTVHWTVHG